MTRYCWARFSSVCHVFSLQESCLEWPSTPNIYHEMPKIRQFLVTDISDLWRKPVGTSFPVEHQAPLHRPCRSSGSGSSILHSFRRSDLGVWAVIHCRGFWKNAYNSDFFLVCCLSSCNDDEHANDATIDVSTWLCHVQVTASSVCTVLVFMSFFIFYPFLRLFDCRAMALWQHS